MGIRIKKVLGWGLDNIQTSKSDDHDLDSNIIDPRINVKNYLKASDSDDYELFFNWLKKTSKFKQAEIVEKAHVKSKKFKRTSPKDSNWAFTYSDHSFFMNDIHTGKVNGKSTHPLMTYDGEYGNPKIMLFTPIDTPDWYRSDDSIDYYMHESTENEVIDLSNRCGIYPFTSVLRKKNAKNLDFEIYPEDKPLESWFKDENGNFRDRINPADFNQLVGRWDKKQSPLVSQKLADYLLATYRPKISSAVLLYTYYFKIFNDWENTVQELKPMLYTYWA